MKYLLALLLIGAGSGGAQALELKIDQVNLGFTGEYEKAEANSYPIENTTVQNGLELYVKTSVGKSKQAFTLTAGKGKESNNSFGDKTKLRGDYYICNAYVGFFEYKR